MSIGIIWLRGSSNPGSFAWSLLNNYFFSCLFAYESVFLKLSKQTIFFPPANSKSDEQSSH